MFIDRMKLAKKEGLANGQLIFWKPGCPHTEDVGVVLDNDWELECTIFWFGEPRGREGLSSRWFDDEEGNVFVLRDTDDQSR